MGSVGNWVGRHCLVTGGMGFIGSNLALTLEQAGAEVVVVDALIPEHGGDRRNLSNAHDIRIVDSLISNESVVGPLIKKSDWIFNVAGQVSHHESMTDPLRDLELNAREHLAFLEMVRRENADAVIVQTSTRQVYGRPLQTPVAEDHPTTPRDINGVSKLAGEFFHRIYGSVHGLRTASLRLTNVYGPRQCLNKTTLGFLPVFISRALRGETIRVFGDGNQRRDCLHVDDVTAVLMESAEAVATDRIEKGSFFNVGTSESITVGNIAEVIVRTTGGSSRVAYEPWPKELEMIDIGDFATDFSRLSEALGWFPRVAFSDGIAATIEFYREHPWYLS